MTAERVRLFDDAVSAAGRDPRSVGIHIKGYTTDLVETVGSMEIEHRKVERAGPGRTTMSRSQSRVTSATM